MVVGSNPVAIIEATLIDGKMKLFIELFIKTDPSPPIIKIDCRTKFLGMTLVLQSVSCFKAMRVFNFD